MVVTLFFADSSTLWAALRRTPRVNLDYDAAVFSSFVCQELLQLVECLRTFLVVLLLRALQVAFFKRNTNETEESVIDWFRHLASFYKDY